MDCISSTQLVSLFLLFFIFVLPFVLVGSSKKINGNKKAVFFILSFFLGWVGYLPYYMIVVKNK